jgi:hypothetical protein
MSGRTWATLKSDISQIRADMRASDLKTLRADVAADILTTRKSSANRSLDSAAVIDYRTSVIGHGVIISDPKRARAGSSSTNLPSLCNSI